MKKKKNEKPLTRAKAKVRIQKTQTNAALMDLKRQLRIEASLDRVRKKALRMKKPDDLLNICKTLYTELQLLGFDDLRNSMINIHNDDNGSFLNYDYAKAGPSITHFTYHTHPVIEDLMRRMKSGRTAFSEQVLSGKRLKEFKAFRKSHGEKTDAKLRDAKALYYYFYSIGTGALGISNLAQLDPDQLKILKRFRNVFDLAYRRYADIKKAETQAREAQIQLALERVRARTMAMQRTDELMEAANLLFQQVQSLGIPVWTCGYNIWEIGEEVCTGWMSTQGAIQPSFRIPLTESATFILMRESRLRGESFFIDEVGGEALVEHYRYMFSLPDFNKIATEQLKDGVTLPESQIHNVFNFRHGNIIFISSEPVPESWNIFQRFTAVFEQTYTRFLDLQKAEAQAREAQIEAALEKVRSRSLAMHRSDELRQVVKAVFDKLEELNFVLEDGAVSILIFKEHSRDHTQWIADPGHSYATPFELVYTDHSISKDLFYAKESGVDFFSKIYPTEEKNEYFKYLFAHSNYKYLPDEIKELILGSSQYGFSVAFTKHAAIFVPTNSGRLLTESEKEILKRLARVFEQTYTRFLDLQKAEAQSREAQIQLALERIRARTMAMRESDELPDAASLLFQQVQSLGMNAWSAGYCILDEDKQAVTAWMSSEGVLQAPFRAPLTEDPSFIHFREAYERGDTFFVEEIGGEELVAHYKYVRSQPVGGEIQDVIFEAGHQLPTFQIFHCAYFSQGFLLFITYERVPEAWDIFKRFAKVFEQTYTRFLDLQKAEGQAREAQIEAALEKVRSRSLAMHHSDELKEVVATIFEKLKELGLVFDGGAGVKIFSEGSKDSVLWVAVSDTMAVPPSRVNLPYVEDIFLRNAMHLDIWQARENNTHLFNRTYSLEDKNEYFNYTFAHNDYTAIPQSIRDYIMQAQSYTGSEAYEKNTAVVVSSFSRELISEKQFEILNRFSRVFEQAYTRFLDLQKAETQAREAQIELALERVRARTMAMQKSSELAEAARLLYDEFRTLDINTFTCGYCFIKEEGHEQTFWVTLPDGTLVPDFINFPLTGDHVLDKRYEDWKQRKPLHVFEIQGEANKEHHRFLASKVTDQTANEIFAQIPNRIVFYCANFSAGYLFIIAPEFLTAAEEQVISRFAKVFEQTYTRFLDLQKAEAQAREAQIEAALEKVRSRSMGMQKSIELREVVALIFNQMKKLGFDLNLCNILLVDLATLEVDYWLSSEEQEIFPESYHIPYFDHPVYHYQLNTWRNASLFDEFELSGNDKATWDEYLITQTPIKTISESIKEMMWKLEKIFLSSVAIKNGLVQTISVNPLSADSITILQRFAKVFEQSYTRFLDLQKAEAQAREAQIEASLERVRARTMAMQKSGELSDVASLMFQQVKELGITAWTIGFNVWSDDNNKYTDYITNPLGGFVEPYTIDTTSFPAGRQISDAKKRGEDFYVQHLEGELLRETYLELSKFGDKDQYVKIREGGFDFPIRQFDHFVFLSNISLMFITYDPVPEAHDVFKRFGKVFEQTYTRFLDLQKAEGQAREAKIEASLERVRGKAMAMHSSADLAATIGIFYRELESFRITPRRCGVGLLDKETRVAELSTMNTTDKGDSVEVVGKLKMQGHPVLEGIFDGWILQQEYHPVLRGNEIKEYYQLVRPQIFFPEYPNDAVQFGYFFSFPEGAVYAWTEKELTEDELKIYRRFTSVLSLTYKRYKDLKDAEIRAKEAVKQATLDRVRAEIASMRTKQDLDRITPLIWNELTILGIPFVRCGVFIMDDKHQLVHTFLSTPDGKAIGAFQLDYETNNLKEAIRHWHDNEVYVTHWGEKEFGEMASTLLKQGSIMSLDQYLKPTEDIHLHFLPFLQGMLYVGNTTRLQEDDIHLLQSLAAAFSTAYARYEDFNNLDAAKQQVEKTLEHLRQAQQQLVQSEKMASLGELTAGIAHEIQNPLNFVNNFSEVSNELIDEMVEEVKKGNFDEAKIIANDLKQNLEKINHHGKRADGIVKSMLQHSRSSSGQKELTDINVLCDEYLRLSYHGLRAKDKSFNAKFETDFDSTLEKINVIPQDIGRVILNLINNAFYAVTEKRNANLDGYDPTVSVSTKQRDDKVEITVKDNGNGIPQKVLDKIFQPFFTTKPTGQGTGLGLSLSYDIVKSHGGELNVETREGVGTEFSIQLPIS